jgi:predicted  nucleic acid-binding Zn-ribbon protein
MEAKVSGPRRILGCAEEAKSPQRILVRSLLKSRNKLRAKYRELRVECKRWRNQAAAVEKSRTAWRQRALTGAAALQNEQAERAVIDSELQELREQSAAREAELAALRAQPTIPEGVEKKGR